MLNILCVYLWTQGNTAASYCWREIIVLWISMCKDSQPLHLPVRLSVHNVVETVLD